MGNGFIGLALWALDADVLRIFLFFPGLLRIFALRLYDVTV